MIALIVLTVLAVVGVLVLRRRKRLAEPGAAASLILTAPNRGRRHGPGRRSKHEGSM